MSNVLRDLQILAGLHATSPFDPIITESASTNYVFVIVDPHTGEFSQYSRGDINQIIKSLQSDPENSMIADVIKQQRISELQNAGGNISFKYDDHIYMFVPV